MTISYEDAMAQGLTKVCSGCGDDKELELTEFYKQPNGKYGVFGKCKVCVKAYRQTPEVIEKHKARQQTPESKAKRKAHQQTPEYIEKRKERYQNNTNFRITNLLRSRLKLALNGKSKADTTLNLLGCDIDELKTHLQETAVVNGYSDFDINNYSGEDYHIDHIIPCVEFDLEDEEDQRKCFHWSNLQILTVNENLSKSDKNIGSNLPPMVQHILWE